MTKPPGTEAPPPPPSDDKLLDEALDETFPASDPIEPPKPEKLPPAHPAGSDVRNR